ncbi:hypothetical protein WA158_005857 [Blastocystis sp. Blastoise]
MNTSMDVVDGDGAYQYGLEGSSVCLVSFTDDGVRLSCGLEGSSIVLDDVTDAIDGDERCVNRLEGSNEMIGANGNINEGSYGVIESSTDDRHPSEAKGSTTQLVHGYSSIHSVKGVSFNLVSYHPDVGDDTVTANISKGDGVSSL